MKPGLPNTMIPSSKPAETFANLKAGMSISSRMLMRPRQLRRISSTYAAVELSDDEDSSDDETYEDDEEADASYDDDGEYDDGYDDTFDEYAEEALDIIQYRESGISSFAFYLNKVLLVVPVGINLLFRSIPSREFRAVAIAWSVILPFTSDISVDEGVFPALVATSLGYENAVVARNMYISIARSRLGLFALGLLSVYFGNYQILICGIMLRTLVSFAMSVLKNSIPKSETTLICGAIVNMGYNILGNPKARMYEPAAIIGCGLIAALPCYPLFARFIERFLATRGNDKQWPLVTTIYVCYFSLAAYLYFGLYGISVAQLYGAVQENSDLFLYWAVVLAVAFVLATLFGSKIGLDGRRKLWHVCTVFMFLPESVRQRELTKVCLAVAIVLFVALETARATALPPFGIPLHRALQNFIDYRDKRGPIVISHIYLLLGIAVPIFLAKSSAGVVCLGLGDTVASQVGRKYGRLRLFGHKSVEGCVAFALATGLALHLFTPCKHIWQIVIPTAFLEAVTPLNDNLVVPMYMLALQGLFTR